MAVITLNGAEIVSISVAKDEKGELKFEGIHHLMSNTGKVLAKQRFNGSYGDITVTPSQQTAKLLQDFVQSIKTDLNTTLGLE
jgi:hypothetical protein